MLDEGFSTGKPFVARDVEMFFNLRSEAPPKHGFWISFISTMHERYQDRNFTITP
jgi:hypothetical protein